MPAVPNWPPSDPSPAADAEYTSDIAFLPVHPSAHFPGRIRAAINWERVMNTFKLQRLNFGSAKALTRDGLIGDFTEEEVRDSLYPPMG